MWYFRDWVPWKVHRARLRERERSTATPSTAPAGNSAATGPRRQRHPVAVPPVGTPAETRPDSASPNPDTAPQAKLPNHGQAASQEQPVHKAHSLIDKVYRWENLVRSWRRVRANKGAHGLDRVTIRMFEADWEKHLRALQRALIQRRFKPTPVRRVYIPKSSDPKKLRPLGIPTVTDRIVQQAIVQIVDPLFDDSLSPRSFGFRKGRRAHDAIATILQDGREGYRAVADADIASFFDRLDRGVTISCVRRRIADGRVLDLIEAFLKAGVCEDGVVTVPTEGTPQGGVISPWLANLVLDDLDKAIEAKGLRHARYADDFVVLCRTRQEAEESLVFVKEVLATLKLSLHETKTRVSDFDEGFEFLGFHFRNYHLGIRGKSIERFKERVRELTRRQQGRNVEAVLEDLNKVVRGWSNYVGVAEVTTQLDTLDRWIRMRVRSFRFKRRCRNDNWRLKNRRLEKWGLLSLLQCRPRYRLSYACPVGP